MSVSLAVFMTSEFMCLYGGIYHKHTSISGPTLKLHVKGGGGRGGGQQASWLTSCEI